MRRLDIASLLTGGLLAGGWLVLGALGQQHTLRWAGGLLPLAVWLAVAGGVVRAAGTRPKKPPVWRAIALGAAAGTTSALAIIGGAGGGAGALYAAAACWGLLLGALLVLAGQSSIAGRRGFAGWLECALPLSLPEGWHAPSSWGLLSARWSMLPMMATLAAMSTWCSGAGGLTTAGWVGLHLGAMLLPGVTLAALRIRRVDATWAAATMLAAGLALISVPGWLGLMVASCTQAVAWGLAGATSRTTAVFSPLPPLTGQPRGAWRGLCPALLVLGIGVALNEAGPAALGAVQASLSLLGAIGLLAASGGLGQSAPARL